MRFDQVDTGISKRREIGRIYPRFGRWMVIIAVEESFNAAVTSPK